MRLKMLALVAVAGLLGACRNPAEPSQSSQPPEREPRILTYQPIGDFGPVSFGQYLDMQVTIDLGNKLKKSVVYLQFDASGVPYDPQRAWRIFLGSFSANQVVTVPIHFQVTPALADHHARRVRPIIQFCYPDGGQFPYQSSGLEIYFWAAGH